jgi:hypothetical protein
LKISSIIIILSAWLILSVCQNSTFKASADLLIGIDSVKAMGIANDWHAKGSTVKSFVTPDSVAFTFPDGKRVIIPLSEDRMVVAIAPFINETHT